VSKEHNHIDDLLSGFLTDATMDAEGIDWASFQSKKKRKRLIWWWIGAAGITVLGLTTLLLLNTTKSGDEEISVSHKVVQEVTSSKPDQSAGLEESKENLTEESTNSINEGGTNNLIVYTDEQLKVAPTKIPQTNSRIPVAIHKRPLEVVTMNPIGYPSLNYVLQHDLGQLPDTVIIRPNDPTPGVPTLATSFIKFGFGPSVVNPSLRLGADAGSFIHKDYSAIRNNGEQNAIGFYMSGAVGKRMGKWSPYVGLGLSHNAVFADYNFSYSEKPIRDIDGTILGYQDRNSEQVTYTSNHSYSMIDIPLGTEYLVKRFPKASISLVGQVSPQVLFSAQGSLPHAVFLNEKSVLSTADYKLNSIAGYSGIMYAHTFNNMEWYVESKYAYNFGLTQVKDLYNTRFNMVVVTFGIKK